MTPGMILPLAILGLAVCVLGVACFIGAVVTGLAKWKRSTVALLVLAGVAGAAGVVMIHIANEASAAV